MSALSPVVDDELLNHVRLACVPGIGGRLRRMLLEQFGSPHALRAQPGMFQDMLKDAGLLQPDQTATLPAPAPARES